MKKPPETEFWIRDRNPPKQIGRNMRFLFKPLALAIGILVAQNATAYSVARNFYRDNPCTANFNSIRSSRITTGTTSTFYANIKYNIACANGETYIDGEADENKQLLYTHAGKYPDSLASLSYDQTKNEIVYRKSSSTQSIRVADNVISKSGLPYWKKKSNAHLGRDDREIWENLTVGSNNYTTHRKYDSSKFTVEPVFEYPYPALPFDPTYEEIESSISQTPRAMLKIIYTENPKYFAMVFCFPGSGDVDFYNKPLIVGDAFDPDDSRGPSDIYFDTKTRKLLSFDPLAPRTKGYDIFFLDFSQGGGNININAMIELKFNEWLRTKTTKPAIIGGPSMSGIIARLALLYSMPANNEMNANIGSNIKGYISIDSPQQGANISPSFLEKIHSLLNDGAVQMSGENKSELRTQRNALNCPAAHQMLFEHYFYDSQSISSYYHDEFNKFLTDLGDYQPNVTRVAIAYSNFYSHPQPFSWMTVRAKEIGAEGIYRDIWANSYDVLTGSTTKELFWDTFNGNKAKFSINLASLSNPNEYFKGTFIPTESALDLRGNWSNESNRETSSLIKYSPFHAIYLMSDEYNGYCSTSGVCGQIDMCSSPEGCSKTADDKRYQHIVFDSQVIKSISQGLDFIESRWNGKVMTPIHSLVFNQ